ncbi:hypothetical protein HPB47_015431 [Ixodes persulcatus]|uniref:Uncharacterized protein n=1 Tax=Ixodes persulcatus TaxID=34615 RepID=A0AC60R2L7_IXOPE|nr:hypothetical protein HPB47_015431 [Ixodes persulcatus]
METPSSPASSDSSNSGGSYVFESDPSSDASDYEEIPEVGHFVFDPLATSSSDDDDDESVAEDDGDIARDDAEEADNAQWHGLEWMDAAVVGLEQDCCCPSGGCNSHQKGSFKMVPIQLCWQRVAHKGN